MVAGAEDDAEDDADEEEVAEADELAAGAEVLVAGLEAGLDAGLDVELDVAAPELVALGEADVVGASTSGCDAAMTARIVSFEDCASESRIAFEGLPGIETTMLRSPRVLTSASATPVPSTRCRMMLTAWLTWPELTC